MQLVQSLFLIMWVAPLAAMAAWGTTSVFVATLSTVSVFLLSGTTEGRWVTRVLFLVAILQTVFFVVRIAGLW